MKVIGCCCIQRWTSKSAERKVTLKHGRRWWAHSFVMFLYATGQHMKKSKQSQQCVLYISCKSNLEKKQKNSKIDLAEEAEVIVLSNHWYKRQMIYCCCGSIMRKAKPGTVATCRRAAFGVAVIWSSACCQLCFFRTTLFKQVCLLFFFTRKRWVKKSTSDIIIICY